MKNGACLSGGKPVVKREDIVRDLRRLGLRRGDILELHSSLSAIGRVKGGAVTVIRAFQEVLGERGTLLMPAFTYSREGGEGFHPDESPVKTGRIPETFRKMKGVLRSLCPIHSVAAWGKRALEFTWRHPVATTLGKGSPFHLAAEAGGKIMLLGCDQNSNSFLHILESLAGHPMLYEVVPYFSKGLIRQDDGRTKDAVSYTHLTLPTN